MKPSAAPMRRESSTCVAIHVCGEGLHAKKTAAAAAAALRTMVGSSNAGRPLCALCAATCNENPPKTRVAIAYDQTLGLASQ